MTTIRKAGPVSAYWKTDPQLSGPAYSNRRARQNRAKANMSAITVIPKPGVGYCVTGGKMFFLDIEHNRYLTLSPRLQTIAQAACSGKEITNEQCQSLVETGLFTPSVEKSLLNKEISSITHNPANVPMSEIRKVGSLRPWVVGLLCLASFHVAAKYFSLKHVVGVATSLSMRCHRDVSGINICAVTNIFERCALIFPRRNRCLPDALALHTFLALLGHSSKIVFGIQPEPFQAHCWVQQGGIVLGQDCEIVSNFEPILTVP